MKHLPKREFKKLEHYLSLNALAGDKVVVRSSVLEWNGKFYFVFVGKKLLSPTKEWRASDLLKLLQRSKKLRFVLVPPRALSLDGKSVDLDAVIDIKEIRCRVNIYFRRTKSKMYAMLYLRAPGMTQNYKLWTGSYKAIAADYVYGLVGKYPNGKAFWNAYIKATKELSRKHPKAYNIYIDSRLYIDIDEFARMYGNGCLDVK